MPGGGVARFVSLKSKGSDMGLLMLLTKEVRKWIVSDENTMRPAGAQMPVS